MARKLTAPQLAALRDGARIERGRGWISPSEFQDRTLECLVARGLAEWGSGVGLTGVQAHMAFITDAGRAHLAALDAPQEGPKDAQEGPSTDAEAAALLTADDVAQAVDKALRWLSFADRRRAEGQPASVTLAADFQRARRVMRRAMANNGAPAANDALNQYNDARIVLLAARRLESTPAPVSIMVTTATGERIEYAYIPNGDPARVALFLADAQSVPNFSNVAAESAPVGPQQPAQAPEGPAAPEAAPSAMLAMLEAQPLNVDAAYPAKIRAQLAEIMTPGPAHADEDALLDLGSSIADALHMGTIDFPDHDALLAEVDAARMTIV